MADPRPVEPRPMDGAADVDSLVALGRADPPPIPEAPAPPPAQEQPADPAPPPDPADEATLNAALLEAGLSVEAEDAAAVRALAALDSETVAAVAKWVKGKKNSTATGK